MVDGGRARPEGAVAIRVQDARGRVAGPRVVGAEGDEAETRQEGAGKTEGHQVGVKHSTGSGGAVWHQPDSPVRAWQSQ